MQKTMKMFKFYEQLSFEISIIIFYLKYWWMFCRNMFYLWKEIKIWRKKNKQRPMKTSSYIWLKFILRGLNLSQQSLISKYQPFTNQGCFFSPKSKTCSQHFLKTMGMDLLPRYWHRRILILSGCSWVPILARVESWGWWTNFVLIYLDR